MRVELVRTKSSRTVVRANIVLGRGDKVLYTEGTDGPEAFEASRALKARAVELVTRHQCMYRVSVFAPKAVGGFVVATWERAELVEEET